MEFNGYPTFDEYLRYQNYIHDLRRIRYKSMEEMQATENYLIAICDATENEIEEKLKGYDDEHRALMKIETDWWRSIGKKGTLESHWHNDVDKTICAM